MHKFLGRQKFINPLGQKPELEKVSSLDFYFKGSTYRLIPSRTRVKKLGAHPQRFQSFEHHLIWLIKLRGLRTFNFEGEICIWIHSNIFPGKGFWFYGNLTGNIRDLTRFGKTRHLGTNRFNEKKRIGKISQSVEYINCI